MRKVALVMILACGLGTAAEPPYAGKWKMNASKSDFGQTTVTYETLPNGEMRATADGMSYNFKTDGKDNMTPWGFTIAWKELKPSSWEMTEKSGAKVTATSTLSLSADGKMLHLKTKRVKADGGTSDDSMSFERLSGGPGLAGKWKTKILKSSSPETLSLMSKGNDGLTLTLGNEGAVCDARFDGKDYPAKGTMWPPGWSCLIAKSGARGIEVMWKKDGKEMYKSTLTASTDGKVLTETGAATASNEPYKIVYDKQ